MGRLLRWLLVPILALIAFFVIANVIVQHVAESKIASTLQSTFHLSSAPSVKISGFPIIVNILRGRLPGISFTSPSATFQGLDVRDIKVSLSDVTAGGGFLHGGPLTIKVAAGTISARATDAAVNAYLRDHGESATIAFRSGGATLRAVRTLLGKARTLVATGTIAREGSSLVFRPTSVTVDGRAPPPGTASLAKQKATVRVQLPQLPGGVSSYGVVAAQGAAVVSAGLHDQTLDLAG